MGIENYPKTVFEFERRFATEKAAANACLTFTGRMGFVVLDVAMGHLNPNLPDSLQYHKDIAKRRPFLAFDEFGHQDYYKFKDGGYPMCSDYNYAVRMKELIQAGFLNQILVAQDVCFKIMLKRYGGFGYGHILRNIKPMLLKNIGLTEKEVQTLLQQNPRTWLTIR